MQHEEMINERIDQLIAEYLSGSLTADAFQELKNWIQQSDETRMYVRNQIEVWFSSGVAAKDKVFDKEEAFARFQKRIGNKEQKVYRFSWKTFYRVAAVILIVLLPLAGYWKGQETLRQTFSDMVVEAPLGARTKLYLPDGTLVWLNAGSRMTYSQGFGVDNRMIELEGEGYFEVRRNEKLPFFVKTKDLQLQVLGTKFNFRDYPEDHEVVVSLLEGKVELNNLLKKEKEAILAPDERAILNKTNGRMTVETVTASNASQWTDGYLFFDEELLPDIVKELERSYNVTIRIANDSLNTFRFYGNFVRREQSIQEVLDALASTEKIQYKIEERNITIY